MNVARVVVAAVLLIFSAETLLARDPMDAVLVVPDVRILPGVPFDFWVELHNGSESVWRVSVCEPLRIRLISGEPFHWTETPGQMQPRGHFYWSHGGEAIVKPGETKSLAIPAYSGLMSGGFFRERVLSAPGRRFGISLPLCVQLSPSPGHPAETSKLLTNEVELDIVSPEGSDALAWNRLQETGKHQWTPDDMGSPENRAMWQSVLRDFPDSNYVPYALLMTGSYLYSDWQDLLARQLRTIERFPDSPAVEWLRVEAWRTAGALRQHGVMFAEGAIVRKSKRPTTQLLAFGNGRR